MLNPKKVTAAELMNRDLVSVHEDTPVEDAIAVLDDSPILSSFDIVRLLAGIERRERLAKKAVEGR